MLDQLDASRTEILHVSSHIWYDMIPAHELRIRHKVLLNRGYDPSTPYYEYAETSDVARRAPPCSVSERNWAPAMKLRRTGWTPPNPPATSGAGSAPPGRRGRGRRGPHRAVDRARGWRGRAPTWCCSRRTPSAGVRRAATAVWPPPGSPSASPAPSRRYGAGRQRRCSRRTTTPSTPSRNSSPGKGIDCAFERTGKLTLACRPATTSRSKNQPGDAAELADHPVSWCRRPTSHDEIGSDYYHGAMVDPLAAGVHVGQLSPGSPPPRSNGVVDPRERRVASCAASAAKSTTCTPLASCGPSRCVVATSGYTGALFPWLRRRMVPIGSFIVVTEPLDQRCRRAAAEPADGLGQQAPPLLLPDHARTTVCCSAGRARFAMSNRDSDLKSGRILRRPW